MHESIDQCIVNCLNTEKGSFPLFREFGINATDQRGRLKRSQIQEQISKFYPDVGNLEVQQVDQEQYIICVSGRKMEGRR